LVISFIPLGDNDRMELHQLEYFVAVAEELSFTRGAHRVHVVQSAVSAAITRLERELGVPLFERSRRRVALTDAGAVLLPEARATLAAAQGARDAVAGARGGLRGTVSMGTMVATGPIDLAEVLGRFHAAHQDVVVRARQAAEGTAAHIRDLRDGSLDLAIISLIGRPPAGITGWPAGSESLVLVCPPGHRYAGRDSVTMDEIAGEAFIEFPAGWGTRVVADRAFAAAGLQRAVQFEVTDYRTAVDMVRNGLGVVFLPASAAGGVTGLPRLAVTGAPLTWTVFIAVAEGRRLSAAAVALVNDLRAGGPCPATSGPGG
jgi:DNA-binding transcriptional LysR family regulator